MPDTRLAESVPADAAPSAGVRAQGPRRLRDALLAAIVLVLAAYWALFHGLPPGPAFSSFAADPEMAYFLSSLGPFKGVGYAYVHHPGTPVQLLGTTLLALSYPFLRGAEGGFVLAHVRHPHVFFLMAHALLGLAGAAGVVAVGTRALAVRHGRDALCAAGLAASFHALSPLGLATTVYWSHNSFSFPFATLLALAAVLALRRRPTLERRLLALLALAAGVLAATQLYLATCAVGLAVTAATAEWLHRRSWRSSLGAAALVAGATAAGFVLSTLPVLHLYPEMFAFVRGLVLRQGLYGTGGPGLPTGTQWAANWTFLWRQAPVLLAAGAAAVALLVATAGRRAGGEEGGGVRAAALGLSVQWVVTLLLLGKHPSRFYLPALAALLPALGALLFARAQRRGGWRMAACAAASVALLALFASQFRAGYAAHRRRMALRTAVEDTVTRYAAAEAAAAGSTTPALVLWAPGLPDRPCFPLWFGNEFASEAFTDEISRVCPTQGFTWEAETVLPRGWTPAPSAAALIVTAESGEAIYPSLSRYGPPELVRVSSSWERLAFYRVSVVATDPVRLVAAARRPLGP